MGEAIRTKDWTTTPLGTPENWPQSLRTTLSILLHSSLPTVLLWGPDSRTFYNDAYIPVLRERGQHPEALGLPAGKVWPRGLSGSYSHVHDESGEPAGVLITCTAPPGRAASVHKTSENELSFRSIVKQTPAGIVIFDGPEFVVTVANDTYLSVVDKTEDQLVGKPFFDVLPEIRDLIHPLLTSVLESGTPYYGYEFPVTLIRHGRREPTWFNFVYQPLRNDAGKVRGIIVVAHASSAPAMTPMLERMRSGGSERVPVDLVLLCERHADAGSVLAWRECTHATAHYFVQPGNADDLDKMVRQVTGRGLGLVLGGGGARGG